MVMPLNTIRILLATGVALVAAVPVAAQDAKVAQGEKVYAAQKCQSCHAIAGKGNKANSLDGVGAKLSADDIRQWIVDPKGMTTKTKATGKPPMPPRYATLPAADVDSLVAYMQSLK
jgi:mono/diheme cytochrome c family protein